MLWPESLEAWEGELETAISDYRQNKQPLLID